MNYAIVILIGVSIATLYYVFRVRPIISPKEDVIKDLKETITLQEATTAKEKEQYEEAKKRYLDKFAKYLPPTDGSGKS